MSILGIPVVETFWKLWGKEKSLLELCKECGGTGKINKKRCPFCDGRGWNIK